LDKEVKVVNVAAENKSDLKDLVDIDVKALWL
jgi:hypothetical protein